MAKPTVIINKAKNGPNVPTKLDRNGRWLAASCSDILFRFTHSCSSSRSISVETATDMTSLLRPIGHRSNLAQSAARHDAQCIAHSQELGQVTADKDNAFCLALPTGRSNDRFGLGAYIDACASVRPTIICPPLDATRGQSRPSADCHPQLADRCSALCALTESCCIQ